MKLHGEPRSEVAKRIDAEALSKALRTDSRSLMKLAQAVNRELDRTGCADERRLSDTSLKAALGRAAKAENPGWFESRPRHTSALASALNVTVAALTVPAGQLRPDGTDLRAFPELGTFFPGDTEQYPSIVRWRADDPEYTGPGARHVDGDVFRDLAPHATWATVADPALLALLRCRLPEIYGGQAREVRHLADAFQSDGDAMGDEPSTAMRSLFSAEVVFVHEPHVTLADLHALSSRSSLRVIAPRSPALLPPASVRPDPTRLGHGGHEGQVDADSHAELHDEEFERWCYVNVIGAGLDEDGELALVEWIARRYEAVTADAQGAAAIRKLGEDVAALDEFQRPESFTAWLRLCRTASHRRFGDVPSALADARFSDVAAALVGASLQAGDTRDPSVLIEQGLRILKAGIASGTFIDELVADRPEWMALLAECGVADAQEAFANLVAAGILETEGDESWFMSAGGPVGWALRAEIAAWLGPDADADVWASAWANSWFVLALCEVVESTPERFAVAARLAHQLARDNGVTLEARGLSEAVLKAVMSQSVRSLEALAVELTIVRTVCATSGWLLVDPIGFEVGADWLEAHWTLDKLGIGAEGASPWLTPFTYAGSDRLMPTEDVDEALRNWTVRLCPRVGHAGFCQHARRWPDGIADEPLLLTIHRTCQLLASGAGAGATPLLEALSTRDDLPIAAHLKGAADALDVGCDEIVGAWLRVAVIQGTSRSRGATRPTLVELTNGLSADESWSAIAYAVDAILSDPAGALELALLFELLVEFRQSVARRVAEIDSNIQRVATSTVRSVLAALGDFDPEALHAAPAMPTRRSFRTRNGSLQGGPSADLATSLDRVLAIAADHRRVLHEELLGLLVAEGDSWSARCICAWQSTHRTIADNLRNVGPRGGLELLRRALSCGSVMLELVLDVIDVEYAREAWLAIAAQPPSDRELVRGWVLDNVRFLGPHARDAWTFATQG